MNWVRAVPSKYSSACAPCPGVGGLEEVLNDAGCLIGYSCTCDLGEELGQCMSDEECGAGEKCTAATDCLTCASCPLCDVCCGVCVDESECEPKDCGPLPTLPSTLCEDGETFAGPGECELQENGMCGWTITTCPEDDFCQDDSDCDAASWCRPDCEGPGSSCVPFQTSGGICGGFVPFCQLEKCDSSAECVFQDQLLDAPGECVSTSPCPDGLPLVSCLIDPCDVVSCPNHPKAECVADYCGGCFANFSKTGRRSSVARKSPVRLGDKDTFPEIPLTGPVITGATPARAWRMEPFHVPRLDAGPSARAMRSAKMDGVGPDAMGSPPNAHPSLKREIRAEDLLCLASKAIARRGWNASRGPKEL